MSDEILLLSGPNLDQLGTRNPEIYGTTTLAQHVDRFSDLAKHAGYNVRHVQSNFEGDLIEAVRDARETSVALVLNAGALTHSSWALADALATFNGPKVEVHLSNPAAREPFRHLSTLAGSVSGSIAGFGVLSYDLAFEAVRRLLDAS
ncbi:MAG TPA: type II 3-dehydroquinate dehydratase [Acidimicrobiales bacterium]|nr:type II 3-dehydroquinate dehydratase [Acidimicrobiales bacterium]